VTFPAGPLRMIPLIGPPTGEWRVPGSKSITNRALLLAALAEGESRLEGVLQSDDTRHMRTGLEALGIEIVEQDATTWIVRGGRSRLRRPDRDLFVGNSGTTVRFLSALAALVPGPVALVGDAHMATRPIQDLVDALRQLGVRVDCETGCPPLVVHGGGLPGGRVSMRGDRSSQYLSAMLMAGALADAPIEVVIEGTLVSRPYIGITERMVADFGGSIEASDKRFVITPVAGYRPRAYVIEPDASAASYPFALAAASRGSLSVPGLGHDALQGDIAFANVLERAGAIVTRESGGTRVQGRGLRGVDEDMHHISDTVMTLAAIAPLAEGPTTIRNVANIRIKETDRLAATVTELRRLGQHVTHGDDWMRIEPRPIVPATVLCYGDHRMAMSFAVLGALRGGITIEDPACVAKTYPGFWDDLAAQYERLGARRPW
jgi:3-phosphoshikimate 1-carboxyvinyltransferase